MFNIRDAGKFIEEQILSHPLFEYYRIVDTKDYKVYEWKDGKRITQGEKCYSLWNRECACQNCISRLAVAEGRPIVKMEMLKDKVFLIESVPLPEMGSHFALELIHDVTESLLINDPDHRGNMALAEIIRNMNDLATHDSYTGLYNKRYMEHELQRETLEWNGEPFVIVLFDIDRFKSINDSYGHLMGDRVILAFAELLGEFAGQNNGWGSRVGGDEFVLVFQGINLREANSLIETFRSKVLAVDFGAPDQSCHISISVGAAEFGPDTGGWKNLFALADQAMYTDKQQRFSGKVQPQK